MSVPALPLRRLALSHGTTLALSQRDKRLFCPAWCRPLPEIKEGA
jgi:hypothetical protein